MTSDTDTTEEKLGKKTASANNSAVSDATTDTQEEGDEITLNFGRAGTKFKSIAKKLLKNKGVLITLLLLIVPIFFSIAIRIQPLYLPITDDWARNSVNTNIQQQLGSQINVQYGNLPPESRQRLLEKEFEKYKEENSNNYREQLKATSKSFKDRLSAPDGTSYLGDIDSYLWLRKAQNILDFGHIGTEKKEGFIYDSHLLAPTGDYVGKHWHPHVIVLFYRIASIFTSNLSLMYVMFFVPAVLAGLSTLFAFLLGTKLTNKVGGFFTAMFVAVHPSLVSRTTSTDTDSYTVLFHVLILWFLAEALTAKSQRAKIAWTSGMGLSLASFSMMWAGWWLMFDIILFVLLCCLGYYIVHHFRQGTAKSIKKDTHIHTTGLVLVTLLLSSFIFISVVQSPSYFFAIQENVVYVPTTLKAAAKANLWPNVYTTVAELNPAAAHNVIPQIGTPFFAFLSFFGLTFLVLRKKQYFTFAGSGVWYWILWYMFSKGNWMNSKLLAVLLALPILFILGMALWKKRKISLTNVVFASILAIWTGAMFYATKNGVRFIIHILLASSIVFGIATGKITAYVHTMTPKLLNMIKYLKSSPLKSSKPKRASQLAKVKKGLALLASILVVIMFLSMLSQPIKGGYAVGKGQTPIFDDAWYNTLTKIKQESQPNAIINSWWDFGHYFKAVGDRAVTFDGGTQNRPQAHWVGKVLLTDDEKQAVAILRMLDCGGNSAYEILVDEIKDPQKTIKFLYTILEKEKEEGVKLIEKIVPASQVENLTGRTYCNPPENYFITSEDMRGKSGVWSHFGSWDFERAKIWQNVRKMNKAEASAYMKKEFNYTDEEIDTTYKEIKAIGNEQQANSWISPWPGYLGMGKCVDNPNDNATILCNNVLNGNQFLFKIDKETHDVVVENTPGKRHPLSIMWMDEKGYHEKKYDNNFLTVSIALIGDNNLLMSPELSGSMFTRLFFYGGAGLEHFDFFSEERAMTTGVIYTWKVDWDGKEK